MMRWLIIPGLALIVLAAPARAQQDKKTDDLKPSDPDTGESTIEEKTLGLLPNPFEKNGIKFAATYIGEVLGNPTGGAKQSVIYEDRINLAVDADLQKLFGLDGLAFHANVFQIDGGGLSRGALFNLLDASGIEALPTTRLYEIWLEKKWNGDKMALRAGQLAADSEFATSKYTDVFTNASLGWPGIFALNLPSGGPSPPLATMGARFRADVTDNLTLVGAVFDGNAAGPGTNDPQLRDRYGVNFRVNDPPLLLSEAQFQWNSKKGDPGLDGKLKLGGWRHLGSFDDERFDVNGVSLASPSSSGIPASFAGDYGVYGVFEQKLFRVKGDDDRGIGVFARASYSPPNRNLIVLRRRWPGVDRPSGGEAARQVRSGRRLRARVAAGAGSRSRFPVLVRTCLADQDVGGAFDRGLPIRSSRWPHSAAERPVYPAPGRRRDESSRQHAGGAAEGCIGSRDAHGR